MKTTLYLNNDLWARLSHDPEDQKSKRINACLDRYATLVDSVDISKLGLTKDELDTVLDAHWSHYFMSAEIDHDLTLNVSDALDEGIGLQRNINGAELISKLNNLSLLERVSLIEWIEKTRMEA